MTDTYINEPTDAELEAEAAAIQPGGVAGGLVRQAQSRALNRPVQVTDESEIDALQGGQTFTAPDGSTRVKPYTVRNDVDLERLPEGAYFVGPDGKPRQKPKYEPLSYSASALHGMAINPKEERKALEYMYPGMVEEGPDGSLVVNDNGVLRKPGMGRGGANLAGGVTAAAAPAILGALGAVGGGAAASPTGVGAVAGAAAGGAAGGILGQAINDAIFEAIAGTERTKWDEFANLGTAGMTSMAGTGVGRGAAAFVPSLKAGMTNAGALLPGAARAFTGATKEGLEQSADLVARGYAVPPSASMPRAAHVQNMVEYFDPAFRTDLPLVQQNKAAYNKEAGEMLKTAGVPEFNTVDDLARPSLTDPTAAIPTAHIGEQLRAKALEQARVADDNLRAAFEARRRALEVGLPESQSQQTAILKAQEESRKAVDNLLNQNYDDIAKDVEKAYAVSTSGANSSEAWQQAAGKLQSTRRALGERAEKMYNDSHALGGNTPIASDELTEAAAKFAEQLPTEFRTTQPAIVRRLEAMAAKFDPETGEMIKPPTNPTFAELHQLRTIMRSNADFLRLNSDIKNGTYKHFNNVIDDVIHSKGAAPELRAAADALDKADAFYREQMPIFNAKQVQAVMRGLEAGEPANPIALYKTLVEADNPALTARLRGIVGPNVWSAVQAAHVDDLMRRSMSKSVRGAVDGPAFARNVLDDLNSGVLHQVQDKAMTDKLLRQVDLLAAARGKLDVSVAPGDKMFDIIAKARSAEEAAKALGNMDPMVALQKASRELDREQAKALGQATGERRRDPLGFLFDAKVGTQDAADRILGSPDLLVASADRFGRDSTEFKLLQQAYLWKILKGDMNPGAAMSKIAPEIQHLMFPGTTLPQLQLLAKNMDFLNNTKLFRPGGAGSSMSAFAKVEHPPQPRALRKAAAAVPGLGHASEFAARATLEKMYALVAKVTAQSPATFAFMLKGLQGTPEQREAVRTALSAVLQRGQAIGAGAAAEIRQAAGDRSEIPQLSPESLGARQAPNGKSYIPDPQRPGKYLEVRP